VRRAVRTAERRHPVDRGTQLHRRTEHASDAGGNAGSAFEFRFARSAGSARATDRHRGIRPRDRNLYRTRWARVHAIRPGREYRRGENMADHDAAGDMRADPQTPPSAAEQPAVEGATGQPEAGSTAPDTESGQPAKEPERTRRFGRTRPGLVLAATVAVALAVVCGLMWNDVRADSGAAADRELFLQAGRQGALNLTTIRW